MPIRPLLPLPAPNREPLPSGHSGYTPLRLPTKERQTEHFGPKFERLRQAIQVTQLGLGVRKYLTIPKISRPIECSCLKRLVQSRIS